MEDIHLINKKLSSQLCDFLDCFVKNESFNLKEWLKENEIQLDDNKSLKLLDSYLVTSFQFFREIWQEPGYGNYWEARELTKTRFRKLVDEIRSQIKSNNSAKK